MTRGAANSRPCGPRAGAVLCFGHDRYPSGLERRLSPEFPPSPPYRVALVGAGTVGTAVAYLLARRGHDVVGVASRTRSSAERAAAFLDAPVLDDPSASGEADVVLVGTPDTAIEEVASRLASHLTRAAVVVHFAGSVGVRPLRAVEERGAFGCALHPVQACPDLVAAVRRLPGSAWGVTCSPGVKRWAEEFVGTELDGTPVPVAEEARALWHAAAVTTSNGMVALALLGEAMLDAIGVAGPRDVLAPLAVGTAANLRDRPGDAVVTGPMVRGDAATVRLHLEALSGAAPDLVADYRLALRLIFAAVDRQGRIPPEARAKLLDAVSGA